MTQHTPGPWHISKHRDGRDMLVYGADDFEIARVCYPNRGANAALIAAAPELLEALKALLAADPWRSPLKPLTMTTLSDKWDGIEQAVRMAEAAIAKAVGTT